MSDNAALAGSLAPPAEFAQAVTARYQNAEVWIAPKRDLYPAVFFVGKVTGQVLFKQAGLNEDQNQHTAMPYTRQCFRFMKIDGCCW